MERIAPVVEKAGFRLADWKEEPLAGTEREERLEQEETGGSRLVWSILLLVPLMYLSMGPMWNWPVPEGSWGLWMNWWTQGILAGAVLWLNRHYLINGVRQLVALSPQYGFPDRHRFRLRFSVWAVFAGSGDVAGFQCGRNGAVF